MATGKSILVVEDETDLADLLRFNLNKEGYVCRCVADGIAALAEVRREAPDLMILDRMLPGLSGEQVMEQVRRNPQTAAIPILMLTARGEEIDRGFASRTPRNDRVMEAGVRQEADHAPSATGVGVARVLASLLAQTTPNACC